MKPEDIQRLNKEDLERYLAAYFAGERQLAFLKPLSKRFPQASFYVVGGAVRDAILGRSTKDFDLVVRQVDLDELSAALGETGRVDLVGRNFGVLKYTAGDRLPGDGAVDVAWPRTEIAGKSGGYRDFRVQADSALSIERDLARRDFSVNAIAFDLRAGLVTDPFHGLDDLRHRVIRAVGVPAERFQEDYSRMLRAIRFACQLGFQIEPQTWEALVRVMPHLDDVRAIGTREERVVPYETASKEFLKALAAEPVRALDLFEESGVLFRLIPELLPLRGCRQPKNHHSEGDVWTHTKLAVANLVSPEFAAFFPGERPTPEAIMAVLLHDIAKPQTAAWNGDKATFYGHPERGAETARQIANRLKFSSVDGLAVETQRLAELVRLHLFPNMIDAVNARKSTLARHFLADRTLGRELLHLAFADASASIPENGRPDLTNLKTTLAAVTALEREFGAAAAKPSRLASGEDVMAITGAGPGPEVGHFLAELHEAQLNGQVNDHEQAIAFIRAMHGGEK